MDNQNVGLALLFGAGLLYMNSSKKDGTTGTTENTFFVPGVGEVKESALPGLGYIKFNGKWFKYSDVQAAAAANGVTGQGNTIDVSTQQGLNIFMTLLNTGLGITTTIINNTAQRKADLIEQITTKYTLAFSTAYDPNFPFTEAQLNALTIKKLKQVLAGDFSIDGINGIATDRDLFFRTKCVDGKYSDSEGRGACSYHGGTWINKL